MPSLRQRSFREQWLKAQTAFLLCLWLGCGSLACGSVPVPPPEIPSESSSEKASYELRNRSVARVGRLQISCGDFLDFASLREKQTNSSSSEAHDSRTRDSGDEGEGLPSQVRSLLEELALETYLAQQAIRLGFDELPAVKEALVRQRQNVLRKALHEEFEEGLEVSTEEIETYFRDHPERFHSPEKLGTRLLLLRLSSDAPAQEVRQVEQRLLEYRQKVAAGESFAALATRYSQAENAARGGSVAASPRGSLLAAYEDVAWSLQPGEVSEPIRLPDGMALIFLEDRFQAKSRTLEESSKGIEARLKLLRKENRRQQALAEARLHWPVEIRWERGEHDRQEPLVRLGEDQLTLEDLGLTHRPPRLEERVAGAVEEHLLLRLAEKKDFDRRPEAVARLAGFRRSRLAEEAIESRVLPRLPEVPESHLKELYKKRAVSLSRPEERRFEVLLVEAEDGRRRQALARARELQQLWENTGKPPEGQELQHWGPLDSKSIGSSVSPRLARQAFSTVPGTVSQPFIMERYSQQRLKFVPEGYVLLRPQIVTPASVPSLEEAREILRQHALRKVTRRLREQVRSEAEGAMEMVVNEEDLRVCSR